ncbi:aminotransferase class I/II-fold pyridoxal phosphate-dependent enzyme [Xiashengella succiniciproducens]|uniref:Aminotransferase class I/II-fold pyridoxal phosphate-dependent enzyme n=1 Tax=Xiashengella succiniciproducens TaxID=2949635 RepID=A0A9J6ZM57_9BACT|nr:aminotransferase class I/II-fold pyridoxal phosphate-dependent enzyme [Alkaliflexus sp. Ai-910]MDI9539557.1 aminotransferase class I/II-fold pyridoxal phosphate-dependent enzyme [Bacteroidota bacterium]URW78946.1 aminotransferase class I/II-fold pyridoxal phosphate-dependent enzyme [Alkaliflexus sp. Ai-910]HHU00347.1 aminotransferase class I/II-fold pyridoxal phosphate-dependent enzyme [Bacteroidales bacterium]
MDIFDKIHTSMGPLGQYGKEAHGYFMFPKLEGEIHPRMKFRGKEVLTWSLNNYLGLANHPEVRKADADAAKEYGLGYPMGARMMSGHTSKHEELEAQLADFVGKEDAYLLNFGYQGMISIIDTLVNRNDVIVYDSESHACIIDGLRLHMGKRFVFPHNNIENLHKQLQRATELAEKQGGGVLVITEGVFGMAGDLGKLDEIVALKKEFNFRILVDDAHGFGTMGKTGAGTAEHFGVADQIDLIFGTFAKSMASIGAFVAGREDVISYLRYNMRSQIFAKSLPMPLVIGALKRLELVRTQPELRENLWNVVHNLQKGLREQGFDLGHTQSPVTPVYLNGTIPEATELTMDLRENYSIFCSIVVYPVVPKGVIMLRIIPTAVHTLEDVDYTIKAFAEIKEKLAAGKYKADKIASI